MQFSWFPKTFLFKVAIVIWRKQQRHQATDAAKTRVPGYRFGACKALQMHSERLYKILIYDVFGHSSRVT